MDLSDVYRTNATEFLAVVEELEPDQLRLTVPACPGWTVHDLLAHQAGLSSDLATGNTDGAATDPWTARQVADRREASTADLVAEWRANLETVVTFVTAAAATGPNPAWDVVVHLDDLREAVDLPPGRAEAGWGATLAAALEVLAQDGTTFSVAETQDDPGGTTFHVATGYGLWRGLMGRLDRATREREVLRGDVDAFTEAAFF